MKNKHRVVTNAVITHRGKILLGKKQEKEGHPISGEWHFPGGHLDKDEEPEEAVVRELKEETNLDTKVHQIVDVTSNTGRYQEEDLPIQIFFHIEAENQEAKPASDLEKVEWIEPSKVNEKLGEEPLRKIQEREEIQKFIERIQKAPY
jgi:ADP-ribose pyrophosphatase